jgi:pheromone shutdown-related protein TraB
MKERIEPTDAIASSCNDVYRLEVGGRELILVGTAHISKQSVDLVRDVIETERPDCVCVELDSQRYAALTQESHWETLDLREVIRSKQLATLLINVLLMSFQKRLGGKLGVVPGSELVEAIRVSEEHGIPIALCDRNIRVTLRRAWHSLPWYRKVTLLASVIGSSLESPELDEEELRRIRDRDVMTELMAELAATFPTLKRVLIDERDTYLAQRIRESQGRKVVAVVGAGHVAGLSKALEGATDAALSDLERIPPVSLVWRALAWAIPTIIVGLLVAIGVTKGIAAAGDSARFWVLANSLPTAFGAVLAIAHPGTIVAALLLAPLTSLTPLVGVSYVAAFTQAWLCPPRVHEFQSVSDDIVVFPRWWSSRLLRVFLVFLLTSVFGAMGTWVGGFEIVSNLVA